MAPEGGGSHNIEVIRDGLVPAVGDQSSASQYDTYTASNTNPQWIGFTFTTPTKVTKLTFTEGASTQAIILGSIKRRDVFLKDCL